MNALIDIGTNCLICSCVLSTKRKLCHHIINVHNISLVEYGIKYILHNNIPKCKCGCGREVNINSLRIPNYINGHGNWHTIYKKNSIEYKLINDKISASVHYSTIGVKKSEIHKKNISIGRSNYIKNNPDKIKISVDKMKFTKKIQSKSGLLSKNHFTKIKSKYELDLIFKKSGSNSSMTKKLNFSTGKTVIWNKNKTSKTDPRILKWSGKNNYRYNPDKYTIYTKLFSDKTYRAKLLFRQNNRCFLCNSLDNLCLHHIDENKQNDKPNNLIYLCRPCHTSVHSNINKYEIFNNLIEEVKNMGYLNNTSVIVDAID